MNQDHEWLLPLTMGSNDFGRHNLLLNGYLIVIIEILKSVIGETYKHAPII